MEILAGKRFYQDILFLSSKRALSGVTAGHTDTLSNKDVIPMKWFDDLME